MADAAAHTTITLAQDTSAVNGPGGRGNAGPPAAALRRADAAQDDVDSQ
jgi:hypothetical protein